MMFMVVEMDIKKVREAFEKLPEIRDSLSEHIVFIGSKYTTPNPDFYDLVNWLNGAWYAWQAKAQAVSEVKLSRSITLTCAQLREALMFGAPDNDDQEQLETEMVITWAEDGHSGKGYYCYYSELPEEGAIFLDEVIIKQEESNS